MILKKIFFKLMNDDISGKTMDNVKKYRDINSDWGDQKAPWYILLYNFLIIHPNLMKLGELS